MTEVLTEVRNSRTPSAGVTAAATLGILGSVSALFAWGWFFRSMLSLPLDNNGRHAYQAHPISFFAIALLPPLLIAFGIRISIGLFQLRPWARRGALLWATLALLFSSSVIAFHPYETFVIRGKISFLRKSPLSSCSRFPSLSSLFLWPPGAFSISPASALLPSSPIPFLKASRNRPRHSHLLQQQFVDCPVALFSLKWYTANHESSQALLRSHRLCNPHHHW